MSCRSDIAVVPEQRQSGRRPIRDIARLRADARRRRAFAPRLYVFRFTRRRTPMATFQALLGLQSKDPPTATTASRGLRGNLN